MKLHPILLFLIITSSCIVNKTHPSRVDYPWVVDYEKEYLDSLKKENKYWKDEKNKVIACRKHWSFDNISDTVELSVLLYEEKFAYDLSSFPNLFIGATAQGEIIGIVDKSFGGIVAESEIITVVPDNWSIREKEYLKPVFFVSPESQVNDLQCKVKKIYYGKIACNYSTSQSKPIRLSEDIIVFNPDSVDKDLAVEANVGKKTNATFKVMNMEGKTVKSVQHDLVVGRNQILLDVSELTKGLYMLKVINGNELNYAQTFRKR